MIIHYIHTIMKRISNTGYELLRSKSKLEALTYTATSLLLCLVVSCSNISLANEKKPQLPPKSTTVIAALKKNTFTTFDGDDFGYHAWGNLKNPKTVVIGSHGISGAAIDFMSLGQRINKDSPKTAIYSYNLRGQGLDPIKKRRGDIPAHTDWYEDLYTFTRLIRTKHPKAEIIWYGESMGGLICTQALMQKHNQNQTCDRLVISAPITNLKDKLAPWQRVLLNSAAKSLPNLKISLDSLAGGEKFEVTDGVDQHEAVSDTNNWHIDMYSLRLMYQLGKHIDKMVASAQQIKIPVYLIHGGKDFFSKKEQIEEFKQAFPNQKTTILKHYPEAFHLILYDDKKEKIFTDFIKWLNQ